MGVGPLKVALYARVSTTDKGQDPETQLHKLRLIAQARDYQVVKEYIDHASGKDDNRPAFQQLMEDSKQHGHDLILIVRIDRIMRSLTNLLKILQDLERYKVGLEVTDQPIDTTTATGRLFLQVTGAFAEWERETIRERVKDGIARARAQGIKLGRPRVPDARASAKTLRRRQLERDKKTGVPSLNKKDPKKGRDKNR